MMLASDHGAVPMNIGALLVLDAAPALRPPGAADVRAVLADRLVTVPRLRQRLVPAPLGCGRPSWADDPQFRLDSHLAPVVLRGGGEPALRDFAMAVVCSRLDRRRPLWAARLVTGWDDRERVGLVVVLHHVLADGVGGLALLASLADDAAAAVSPVTEALPQRVPGSSHRPPSTGDLARDAWRERVLGLGAAVRGVGHAMAGLRELGLGRRPEWAERTSLNRPTGGRRRLATVELPLDAVTGAAHRMGCTVNDLLVTSVVGALTQLLRQRGESPRTLVVSVPLSARERQDQGPGNQTGVLLIRVPTSGGIPVRLAAVQAQTAQLRGRSDRGSSAAPLSMAFQALAGLGLFRPFVEHQRLVNTFVSNLRGPAEPLRIAGHEVSQLVPVGATPGNVGVTFTALSYAGRLAVSVVTDPDLVPDLGQLEALLHHELDGLC